LLGAVHEVVATPERPVRRVVAQSARCTAERVSRVRCRVASGC
jgi:hypothetical protein